MRRRHSSTADFSFVRAISAEFARMSDAQLAEVAHKMDALLERERRARRCATPADNHTLAGQERLSE